MTLASKLALLTAGTAATAACLARPEDKGVAPGPTGVQDANNVTALYNDTCAKCHGARGEGGGAGTKTLLTAEKFEQSLDKPFFDAIKDGVKDMGMEAYGGSLNDRQIWALVVHLRELQFKGLRASGWGPRSEDGVWKTDRASFRIEKVLEGGMSTPWSVDWLPDGRMLMTNRNGSLWIVKDGQKVGTVANLPKSVEQGQGGMSDVRVHPDYAKNGWVYLALADPAESGRGAMTKVVRGKLSWTGDDASWTSEETVYQAPQETYSGAGIHFGAKIAFDGKGHVYFSVGERGTNMGAQSQTTPYGKIMRLNEDGSVPKDNPVDGNPMWSYGHRNPQGLAFDAEGRLWDTEHGPRGGDEFNLIQKGGNYGWPVVAFSINYNDTPFVTPWPAQGQDFVQPVYRWLPSIAASGLTLVKGDAFPGWKGDLLAGGLAGNTVWRMRVKDGKLIEREEVVSGIGRIRDINVAPDGTVYIAVNGPDRIVRLVPTGS
ncbi:MAG: PQQ-dependent sugar dehydrogenase [Armatimonadetes bacterium]|nr:PQQ-dependent sugar dehydrogenase [Armatimonadota bacterium]